MIRGMCCASSRKSLSCKDSEGFVRTCEPSKCCLVRYVLASLLTPGKYVLQNKRRVMTREKVRVMNDGRERDGGQEQSGGWGEVG